MFGWATLGKVKFAGEVYDCDVCVNEKGEASRWEHAQEHELTEEDLLSLLTTDTVAIVVGCGHHGQLRLSEGAKKLVEEKQLELHFFQTSEAVKEYNAVAPTRKTIAFVHASC